MDAAGRLAQSKTLMLDMDGTVLDLAYDNYMWLRHIPAAYAERHGLDPDVARETLYGHYRRMSGQLHWYCLDHWSERLGLDILGLHRAERSRIGWLPGAREFLASLRDSAPDLRVLLVTNSHRDTLALKAEETGVYDYFDAVHSAHDFGYSKEQQAFWKALAAVEAFDPATTLFVDDTETVLASAGRYGVAQLLTITHPDTSRAPRPSARFAGIEGLRALLG